MTDIIGALKALPFTLEVEQDRDGVFVQTKEFPDAFDEEPTFEETLKTLAHSLKEWGQVTCCDIDAWRRGREEQLPYLLKIIISSEEELLECLRNARCENS